MDKTYTRLPSSEALWKLIAIEYAPLPTEHCGSTVLALLNSRVKCQYAFSILDLTPVILCPRFEL